MKQLEDIIKVLKNHKGYIFICGNGGSSSIASHLSNDFIKMDDLKVMSLTDNIALITAISNDLSYEDIFSYQIKRFSNVGDILIVLSGSGNSKNIINALRTAKERNLKTIAFLGMDGGVVKNWGLSDIIVHKSGDMQDSEDNFLKWGHYIAKELKC